MQAFPPTNPPPVWYIAHIDAEIGAFLLIIATWVTIYFTVFRNKKSLAYQLSASRVLKKSAGLHSNIVISYDAGDGHLNPVENVYTAVLTLRNTGKQEIVKQDFDGNNIEFSFPAPIRILNASVTECMPPNIANHINFERAPLLPVFSIKPMLMNSGDSITISILVSDVPNNVSLLDSLKCDARIKGIREVSLDGPKVVNVPYSVLPLLAPLIPAFLVATYWFGYHFGASPFATYVQNVFWIISVSAMIYGILRYFIDRR